jgi:hypothetical protein
MRTRRDSTEDACAVVAERLRARGPEIEQAILAGVRAVPDPASGGGPVGGRDSEYLVGLRAAVTALVTHALTGIEQGEEWSGPIPSAAVAQAQRAARAGVGQETVLRHCLAGHALLDDFVIQEAERGGFLDDAAALRRMRRTQASLLDRLIAAIVEEHTRELRRTLGSAEQRRAERVCRVLAGEFLESAELDYEVEDWHTGLIATGVEPAPALRGLAGRLGRPLLCVSRGENTVWAWLGGRRALAFADLERALPVNGSARVSLAAGEPGRGIEGFRLTHRQAQAALLVALHQPQRLTRFADVALIAPWLRDDELARSLVELYLSPLDGARDGPVLRATLREYFAAGRNAKTAAAALKVDRGTVGKRLRTIERLGCPLHERMAELEVAMRLEQLRAARDGAGGPGPA